MLARLPEGHGAKTRHSNGGQRAGHGALEQTASVFTKSFYVQLGADTDAMQTNLYPDEGP